MNKNWLFFRNGRQSGPYSTEEVFSLIWDGQAQPFDTIRDVANSEGWSVQAWAKTFGSTRRALATTAVTAQEAAVKKPSRFNSPAQPETATRVKNLKKNNPFGAVGFCLGVASVFLSFIGLIPLLGIIFSAIGLVTFDDSKHLRKWQAKWGLGLSVAFMLVNISISRNA